MAETTHRAKLVTTKIEAMDGLFLVTSPDMPELHMAYANAAELASDLPNLIARIMFHRTQERWAVLSLSHREPPAAVLNWAAIPARLSPYIAALIDEGHIPTDEEMREIEAVIARS